MNAALDKQMSLDYCCSEADLRAPGNCFTEYIPPEGRRRFDESDDGCFLKIAVYRGKILATGQKDVIDIFKDKIGHRSGAWFMDAGCLSGVERILNEQGYQISQVHVFFTAEQQTEINTDGYEIRWFERDDIPQFADDDRFDEAFAFSEHAPDVLGVAAIRGGEIVGMAGASADSPYLWQIGINVTPDCAGEGIGSMLVGLLKNEVLLRGRLPYYGTAMSHLASQRVALKAGFSPAWVELLTEKK